MESLCKVPSLLDCGAAQENLFYFAWGNRGGGNSVALSPEDYRRWPTFLDLITCKIRREG